MTGSVEEGYSLFLHLNLISSDMLCDSTSLRGCNVRVSDSVEKRCFTVVYMSHNYNHRASFLRIIVIIVTVVDKTLFNSNNNFLFYLSAHFVCYKRRGIIINHFVNRSHNAESHKLFDNLRSSRLKPCRKFSHGYLIGYHDFKLLVSGLFQLYTAKSVRLRFLFA